MGYFTGSDINPSPTVESNHSRIEELEYKIQVLQAQLFEQSNTIYELTKLVAMNNRQEL